MAIPDINQQTRLGETIRILAKGRDGAKNESFLKRHFFAHYTSAQALVAIADSRSFLMRNTRLMNDHSEVRHGFKLTLDALTNSDEGRAFLGLCEQFIPGATTDIPQVIDEASHRLDKNVYVLSLCEHEEPDDRDGKLSMWRAYGDGDIRIALIGRPQQILTSGSQGVLAAPAIYGGTKRLREELAYRTEVIEREAGTFASIDPETVRTIIAGLTINLAVSMKHEGFAEEREWRLAYMPDFKTDAMEKTRTPLVLGGVPQVVYKLPFIFPSDEGYDPSRLMLEKIILGPCAETETVRAGLVPPGRIRISERRPNGDVVSYSLSPTDVARHREAAGVVSQTLTDTD